MNCQHVDKNGEKCASLIISLEIDGTIATAVNKDNELGGVMIRRVGLVEIECESGHSTVTSLDTLPSKIQKHIAPTEGVVWDWKGKPDKATHRG